MDLESGHSFGPRFSRTTVYAVVLDYLRWSVEREIAAAEEGLAPRRTVETARHKLAVLRDLAQRNPR